MVNGDGWARNFDCKSVGRNGVEPNVLHENAIAISHSEGTASAAVWFYWVG